MAIKVGLIGISGYSSVHFANLEPLVKKGIVELLGVVVINPEQVPEQLKKLAEMGVKVYPSTDAMYAELSGKLDLVCIPTGIALHSRMTVEALKNGANVLVEKPAAGSVEDVKKMMAAEAGANGKFVAIGFQHMYAREVQFIKQYLISGKLGKVKQIICSGIWPRNDAYYARNNWAGKLYAADGTAILDSPINNAFAHYLNMELFYAGERFEKSAHVVSVEGNLYRARDIETFDTCAVRFTTDSGIKIVTLLTHAGATNVNPQIEVECENGKAVWNSSDWKIISAEGKVLHSGASEAPQPEMFMDIMNRINGNFAFTCPLAIGLEHTNCIEMMTKTITPIVVKETVSRNAEDGQYLMDNIVEVFAECQKTGKLPAEMGVVWK